jgi:hypothetical protein
MSQPTYSADDYYDMLAHVPLDDAVADASVVDRVATLEEWRKFARDQEHGVE